MIRSRARVRQYFAEIYLAPDEFGPTAFKPDGNVER